MDSWPRHRAITDCSTPSCTGPLRLCASAHAGSRACASTMDRSCWLLRRAWTVGSARRARSTDHRVRWGTVADLEPGVALASTLPRPRACSYSAACTVPCDPCRLHAHVLRCPSASLGIEGQSALTGAVPSELRAESARDH